MQEYSDLAASMRKNWEYIIYVTAGRGPTPKWDTLSSPAARSLHEMTSLELKRHTKHIVFIDDCWIGVRAQHPDFNEPNDQGYHFGYVGAVNDPATSQHRAAALIKRLQGLMYKICEMVYVVDYPTTPGPSCTGSRDRPRTTRRRRGRHGLASPLQGAGLIPRRQA